MGLDRITKKTSEITMVENPLQEEYHHPNATEDRILV